MKAVLLSVRPQWCELIANGKKTLEVRKTRPKLGTPFKVYIYCTQAKPGWFNMLDMTRLDGKVIGEFVCDEIRLIGFEYGGIKEDLERALNGSCLTNDNARHYFLSKGNKRKDPFLFGWHISALQIYDKPRELSEFRKPIMPTGLRYEDDAIKRAPQSWCYIEEARA